MAVAPRSEIIIRLPSGRAGKVLILRDRIVPEDLYLNTVRAKLAGLAGAFSYVGQTAPRSSKDSLIRSLVRI